MAVRTLALCAGAGGLELGLKLACPAVRLVGAVERQAYAAAILGAAMVRGDLDLAPIFDDVAEFDGRAWRGVVDLVSAGYPCQGESVAGKQLGVDDKRWLWPHVWRVVHETGARYLFCENVPNHLNASFKYVLSDLAACGWSAEWDLVPAQAVGAPHIRERLFFLACAPDADGDELRQLTERDQRQGRRVREAEREQAVAVVDGEGGLAVVGDRAPQGARSRADADGKRRKAKRDGGQLDEGKRKARGRDANRRGSARPRHTDKIEQRADDFPEEVVERLAELRRFGAELWDWHAAPEPSVLGVADGVSSSVDRAARDEDERIVAIGNGVVPLAAAHAFTVLAWRLLGVRCF